MKKMTTFAAAFLLSIGMYGQTCIHFEDKELNANPEGFWTAGAVEENRVVENPDKNGLNPSDRCYSLVVKSNDATLGINGLFALEGNKRVSFLMKKATNGNAKLNLETITNNEGEGEIKHNRCVFAWHDGGDEWRRVVCDFSTDDLFYDPTLVMITPQEWDVPAEGVTVYLDDIRVEPMPRVNGVPVWEADLEGTDALQLTGNWLRGSCQKENFDEANKVDFDDYAALSERMKPVTSVDLRGAAWTDGYWMFSNANANALIYAHANPDDVANVVIDGRAARVALYDGNPFACPEAFEADTLTYKRYFIGGEWTTVALPYRAATLTPAADEAEALPADAYRMEAFDGLNGQEVRFGRVEAVSTEYPVAFRLTEGQPDGDYVFGGSKQTVNPTAASDATFRPVWKVTEATGYVLAADGASMTAVVAEPLAPFRAYLAADVPAEPLNVLHSDTPTNANTLVSAPAGAYAVEGGLMVWNCTPASVRVVRADGLTCRTVCASAQPTFVALPAGIYLVGQTKVVVR